MSRIRVFPFSPKLQRTTAACAVSAAPSTVSQRRDWAAYCVVTHMTPWKFVTRNTQQTLWLSSGVHLYTYERSRLHWFELKNGCSCNPNILWTKLNSILDDIAMNTENIHLFYRKKKHYTSLKNIKYLANLLILPRDILSNNFISSIWLSILFFNAWLASNTFIQHLTGY